MQIINLFGGPCAGKSCLAASVYVELKKASYNVELCSEYAKELVYEKRLNVLKNDQLYVFANQNHALLRLMDNNLDYVICDSPILLSVIYNTSKYVKKDVLRKLVLSVFNSYDNINFFIDRGKIEYTQNGRIHSLQEALKLDEKIKKELEKDSVPYTIIKNNNRAIDKIIESILAIRFKRN